MLNAVSLDTTLTSLYKLRKLLKTFVTKLISGHLVPHASPLVGHVRFINGTLFVPCFLVKMNVVIGIQILFASPRAV